MQKDINRTISTGIHRGSSCGHTGTGNKTGRRSQGGDDYI